VNVLLCSTYELGHQPLGLASPAAHLRAAGFPVECRDLAVERLAEASVRAADVVGISVPMHTAIRLGALLAAEVRAIQPRAHVCFYGLYASLNGDYLLANGGDSVVGGEYEQGLVSLVRRLDGEAGEPAGVRLAGGAPVEPHLGRLRFLVPARDGLPPPDRYAFLDLGHERRTAGYVEASRGCAHRCLHCPIPPVYGGRLRIVQEDVVLSDVDQLVAMGVRHIDFGDPDFLNGVRHSLRIVRRMHERHPDLTFDFTAKVEHLIEHRDVLPEMARLGCVFVQTAVESLSETVLRHLDKGHTAADVRLARRIADRAGIALRPTFVAFTPWTTRDDYLDVLDFVEEMGWIDHVPPVQYTIRLLIPPGSALLGRPRLDGLLGGLDEARFSYEWRHPDPAMDELHPAVSALVERAEADGEDPCETFHRVRSLAGSRGRGRRAAPAPAAGRPHVPRLSEPWFC